MNNEDFNSIFRIVSSVMLFGSMQFKQERNSDQATLPDNTVAQKIAHLLGKIILSRKFELLGCGFCTI